MTVCATYFEQGQDQCQGARLETHLLAGTHTMRFVCMLHPAPYCCQLTPCPKTMRLVRTCSHDQRRRPKSKQSMALQHMPTCIADILLTRTSLRLGLGCQCIQHIQQRALIQQQNNIFSYVNKTNTNDKARGGSWRVECGRIRVGSDIDGKCREDEGQTDCGYGLQAARHQQPSCEPPCLAWEPP